MTSIGDPDSPLLAFCGLADLTSDWFALYVMRADGSGLRRVSPPQKEHATDPAWSLDGRYLLYAAGGTVYRVDPEGSRPLDLTPETGGVVPRPMPDGRTILYAGQTNPWYWELVPLDGGPPHRPFGERRFVEVAFSPDGALCAATVPGREEGFLVVTPSGETVEELAGGYWHVMEPAWSPDGRIIAFTAAEDREGTTSSLFVLRRSTGDIGRIGGLAYEGTFSWAPDGQSIAYVAPGDPNDELVLARLDDSPPRTLLAINPGDESGEVHSAAPAWSANGHYLAMSTLDDYDRGFEIRVFAADGEVSRTLTLPIRFDLLYDLAWRP